MSILRYLTKPAFGSVRLDFDQRSTLQFRGSLVTSDVELLADRELDGVGGAAGRPRQMTDRHSACYSDVV